MDDDESMPTVLAPALKFVALCLEEPEAMSYRVAFALTVCAMIIGLAAVTLGVSNGAGIGLLYATSAWMVSLALRFHSEKETGEC